MYLKEFAEQRNVKPNTVAVYMKSHEKEFKGHTWLKNELQCFEKTIFGLYRKVK